MSTNLRQSLPMHGEPLREEVACREKKLDALLDLFKLALEERAEIKHESKLLKERIESVNNSSVYRTRVARAKRLEELNATAAHESQYQKDFNASTAKAWAIRKKVDKAIEHHRTAACRALCEDMQRVLPRELRDMIYAALFDQKTWAHCEICRCFAPGVTHKWHDFKDKYFPPLRCRATMPKHLRTSDALGTETYRELGEIWYQTTPSYIDTAASIARFLHDDVFNIGINAASHSRRVTLMIVTTMPAIESCDKFRTLCSDTAQKWVEGVKHLTFLNKSAIISVRINHYAGDNSPGRMEINLEILQRILFTLLEISKAGNRVTIQACEYVHGISALFDRKIVTLDNFIERVQKFIRTIGEV